MFGRGGLLVVVGIVVAVPGLFAGSRADAEDDGVAELREGGALFVVLADLLDNSNALEDA